MIMLMEEVTSWSADFIICKILGKLVSNLVKPSPTANIGLGSNRIMMEMVETIANWSLKMEEFHFPEPFQDLVFVEFSYFCHIFWELESKLIQIFDARSYFVSCDLQNHSKSVYFKKIESQGLKKTTMRCVIGCENTKWLFRLIDFFNFEIARVMCTLLVHFHKKMLQHFSNTWRDHILWTWDLLVYQVKASDGSSSGDSLESQSESTSSDCKKKKKIFKSMIKVVSTWQTHL